MMTGACFCKAVRYELLAESQMQGLCYCTDCQVLGGSSHWTSYAIAIPDFRLTGRRVSLLYLRSRIRKASDPLFLWGLWHPDQGAV